VEVPYHLGLEGHSDGDVLLHALADALLGAAALGDLGRHFPDSDPGLADASSLEILRRTAALAADRGWRPVNIDSTVVAEQPRVVPRVERMREAIAGALGLSPAAVSVKATSTEGLGFEGRGEGISASATVLLRRTAEGER
jgi:2-C-methyl-D-erythritol 2,4-cyclodiphosphate synthase